MPQAGRSRIPKLNSEAARRLARRGVSLRGAGIGPTTEKRYLSALASILPVLESIQSLEGMDEVCEEWIEQQWARGAPLGLVGDALCAVHYYWPQMKGRIRGAWKLFRNWRRLEVPVRAPPLPAVVARALVGLALEFEMIDFAFLIGLAFHAFLRTGEFLKLKVQDIQADLHTGVVRIQASKSGLRFNVNEAVAIYDRTVLRIWELFLLQKQRRPTDLIWSGGAASFRKRYKELLFALHVDTHNFQCYSLRRGGATHQFMQKRLVDPILIRGRWRSIAVARLYLEDGLAHLATLGFPPTTSQLLHRYSSFLPPGFLT